MFRKSRTQQRGGTITTSTTKQSSNLSSTVPLVRLFLGAAVLLGLAEFNLFASYVRNDSRGTNIATVYTAPRCAINFWGLPRAFDKLVLPSIVKNVIAQNPRCDYYVHYYHKTEEESGRSGSGGTIDPTEILHLKDAVLKAAKERGESPLPIVEFAVDTEEDFWKQYTPLIETIRNTKTGDKYLYFPWKAKTYKYPTTTDNIVKMWHTIQSSFELMEKTAASRGIVYDTVAMLRSDVVYVTPIDIHDGATNGSTGANNQLTIPDFGNHPVSDRIIYGPTAAVKIWATERFSRLDQHVESVRNTDPGWGMHSERFLSLTTFPLIREKGFKIRPHPTICFLRARADESVWISDCGGDSTVSAPSIMKALGDDAQKALEETIGRPCPGKVTRLTRSVQSLDCASKTVPKVKR